MKILWILFISFQAFSWGHNGHRVVGEIAERHLSFRAKNKLKSIMNGQSLAEVSTWPDEIRSNPRFNFMAPSHYTSVLDKQDYKQERDNDIVSTIKKLLIAIKKDKPFYQFSQKDKIAFLIHFIGDLHQPLHVGRATDLGGNRIRVQWFGKQSNLHKVWDTGIIKQIGLSYKELVEFLDKPSRINKSWYADQKPIQLVNKIANESSKLRPIPYNFNPDFSEDIETLASLDDLFKQFPHADNKKYKKKPSKQKYPQLSYNYLYRARPVVEQRLLQAGLRLAAILNKILI
jgi:hypothetical protein